MWIWKNFDFHGMFSAIPNLGLLEEARIEAATRNILILLGGSLIPIVFYRDGDGFSLYQFHVEYDIIVG